MNDIHTIDQQAVIKLLSTYCGVILPTENNIQRDLIIAEYLRFSLYKLSFLPREKRFAPIYVSQLLNEVHNRLEAVWEELNLSRLRSLNNGIELGANSRRDDPIRQVLEQLNLLGDCVHIGRGYWLPSPVRLVRLPNSDKIAVLGGLATPELKRLLPTVQLVGLGRLISDNCSVKQKEMVWQDYHNWVGWIPEELPVWTERVVDRVMIEGSTSSPTFMDFEVYVLDRSMRHRNFRPWIPATAFIEMKTTGIQLCRTEKPGRYFLGKFVSSQLVKELFVTTQDMPWLRLGLHPLKNMTPFCIWKGNYLTIFPPLPQALRRNLAVYSYALISEMNHTFYYVPPFFRSDVEKFLGNYGYFFKEKNLGGEHFDF